MDKFEKTMWSGFGIALSLSSTGAILTIVFENGSYLLFGLSTSLIVWLMFSIYHRKYIKSL